MSDDAIHAGRVTPRLSNPFGLPNLRLVCQQHTTCGTLGFKRLEPSSKVTPRVSVPGPERRYDGLRGAALASLASA